MLLCAAVLMASCTSSRTASQVSSANVSDTAFVRRIDSFFMHTRTDSLVIAYPFRDTMVNITRVVHESTHTIEHQRDSMAAHQRDTLYIKSQKDTAQERVEWYVWPLIFIFAFLIHLAVAYAWNYRV